MPHRSLPGTRVLRVAPRRGARQRPVPDVKTIEDLKSEAYLRALDAELRPLVLETLHHDESERFQLNVYLGRHPSHQALAEQLFARVRALLRAVFALRAAEECESAFDYRPQPNWATYKSLLEARRMVRRNLRDLRPRDQIDVQSFLWVQGSDEYD